MDRRNFFSLSFQAGLGIVGLSGLSLAKTLPISKASKNEDSLPYPYVELDPEKIANRAYVYYHKGHCAYAVFASILDELKEKIGAPYKYIPSELYVYGKGGVVGWGTLCGALNGAAGIITLTCKDYAKVIDALYNWYQKTPLPDYTPKGKESYPKSISSSPLCHVSVMKWCKAATEHFKRPIVYNSKERSERCARLSASVARKAVELLNSYHKGTFIPVNVKGMNKTKMDCRECHTQKKT
ncbi:C-GCAxxG-C-C family (seleno)protein [Desulfurobacterium crinifex]